MRIINRTEVPVKADITVHTNLTRTIGTTYQNTNKRPMLVMVTALCDAHINGDTAYMGGWFGTGAVANVLCGQVGWLLTDVPVAGHHHAYFQMCIAVPRGGAYMFGRTIVGTGVVTIHRWQEIIL